ncbi:MscL family protein [Candidatus Woesearchaeota archaeon]|nr:MscL family protein [Candidatus Woesearchaeota archaeon]
MTTVFKEFKKFLKDFRIIGLSTAFVVGMAASNFIQALINDIALPIIRPLVSGSTRWEDIILPIGSVNLRAGSFLSALLNLFLVVLFLYIFVDRILHWKPKK